MNPMVTAPNAGAPMGRKAEDAGFEEGKHPRGAGGKFGSGGEHAGKSNADLRDEFNKHVGSGNKAGAESVRAEQDRRASTTQASFSPRKPTPEKKPTQGNSTRARLLRGRDSAMYPDENVGAHPAKNLDEGGRDCAMDAPGAGDWPGRTL